MKVESLTVGSAARLEVVELRLRIEKIATKAVGDSFPAQPVIVSQTNIRNRLVFILVAYEGRTTSEELLSLLRLMRHIYKRTSDVLHGRSNMVNLPDVLLTEWSEVLLRIENISE